MDHFLDKSLTDSQIYPAKTRRLWMEQISTHFVKESDSSNLEAEEL
jgi:hypothetical protein